MWGNLDPASTLEWHGDCRNGRAMGLGIVILTSSQHHTSVGLEEYGNDTYVVTYRQVTISPREKFISKGRMAPGMSLRSATIVHATSGGNPSVTLLAESCRGGECTRRGVDPLTGSVFYDVRGASGYAILWNERRADNQALFTHRTLSMDGATPIEKVTTDGGIVDIYSDLHSGRRGWVTFPDEVNAVLALPVERFSAVSNDLQMAVQESDEKFASVFDRFCRDQKDINIRTLCDPSGLIPSEEELAAARMENNEYGRAQYQAAKNGIAIAQARSAQIQAEQIEQRGLQVEQQALAAEQRRQANLEGLRRSFEAINQAGQDAQRAAQQMMQSSQAPQVQMPELSGPTIVHCRTIGYITTCN